MRKILVLLALFLIVACLPVAVSLMRLDLAIVREPRFDVVTRETSPDHLLDAVHVVPRTGATDGFAHWVCITAAGRAVADAGTDDPIFVADQADSGIKMSWATDTELIISADAARVFKSKETTIRLPNGESRQVVIKLDIGDLRRP
jgi:hypothetical protein